MRAISLWQPWASAMCSGVKRNETRSWPTSYRGDLLICSAKRKPSLEEVGDMATFETAMAMPYGCALCVVELYDCVPTALFYGATPLKISEAESSLGDYTAGRFAWLTRNCRKLKRPMPILGHQGLWIISAGELETVRTLVDDA